MKHREFIREHNDATVAVLMIHGICSTPRHFDWLLPEIPEEWSIYNILLDGHGGTVPDFSATSMKKWKAQVHGMLDILSARYDRIMIIGFSMGTLLAIEALPNYEKIHRLLLLNVPLRPWVRVRMALRALRFTFGKVRHNDPHESACWGDISITLTTKLWQYLGWIPRFIELLGLCRYCRKTAKNIAIPCRVFLGRKDELVSTRSARYFENNPHVDLTIFDTAGHFHFEPKDKETVREALHQLIKDIN